MSTIKQEKEINYQVRNISFTLSNLDKIPNYETTLNNYLIQNTVFAVWEYETGEQGSKHIQGYMQHEYKIRFSTLRSKIFPGFEDYFHTEKSKKCRLANYRYCSKEGKPWVWDKSCKFHGFIDINNKPEELGYKNKKNKNNTNKQYQLCIEMAKANKFEQILKFYPQIYLKFKTQLEGIRLDHSKVERLYLKNKYGDFFKCHFLWLYGETGLGKSNYAYNLTYILQQFYILYSNKTKTPLREIKCYYKNKNKWWDRYQGEDLVIIEEMSPEYMKTSATYFKQWIDDYPFNPEIKGATINYIRPKFIVVTSNYSLKECCTDNYGQVNDKDFKPLERRFFQFELKNGHTQINWPNIYQLTKYENTINQVKLDSKLELDKQIAVLEIESSMNKSLNDLEKISPLEEHEEQIKFHNLTTCKNCGHLCKENECQCEQLQPLPKKDKGKKPEQTTTTKRKNDIEEKPLTFEEWSTSQKTPEDISMTKYIEYLDLFEIQKKIKLFTIKDFYWNNVVTYCIRCFTYCNHGLFCKECAKVEYIEDNRAQCKRCKQMFTTIIDAHCPSCTIALKERYKHIFEVPEDQLQTEPDYEGTNIKNPWYNNPTKLLNFHNNIKEQYGMVFDGFNNLFFSKKQQEFVYQKLQQIYNLTKLINTKYNPTKKTYDQLLIDQIVDSIENILTKYDLRKYRYYPIKRRWKTTNELQQIANKCSCWYCEHNQQNKCMYNKNIDDNEDYDQYLQNN